MNIYDVSAPINSRLPCWPGSVPHRVEWNSRVEDGAIATVSSWILTSHTGTHVDAPSHFFENGLTIDQLDVSLFLGPCEVVDLRDAEGHISASDLVSCGISSSRVLLKTANSLEPWWRKPFRSDYVGLSEDGAAYLRESGIILVGTDYLSIEPFEQVQLGAPTHLALLGADIPIIEGLSLADTPGGKHTLCAVPLKLSEADGAPLRAVIFGHQSPLFP